MNEVRSRHTSEILIVEDSPTQAQRLRYSLEQAGYHVTVAAHGWQALEAMRQRRPALIISDITMPEMNGYELCRHIKAHDHSRDIPVILLTSLSSPADVIESLACGADSFITKPYGEDYLLSFVGRLLADGPARAGKDVRVEVEIPGGDGKRRLNVGPQQMLTLLLSTYEAAVHRSHELFQAQAQMRSLSENLEALVQQRTSALSAEIANRRQINDALQQSEQNFRNSMEGSVDGMVVIDSKGVILWANLAAGPLFGREVRALVGSGSGLPATHGKTTELNLTRPHQEVATVEMREVDIQWEGGPARLAYLRDITERKRVEEQLQESHEMFRSLAGVAPAGIFRTDETDRCVFVNQHWSSLTGISEEQALDEGWSTALHPEDRARVLREWNEAARLQVPFHSEYRFQRPDGSVNWVIGQAVELKHPEGRVLGHVGAVFDITGQKQTEAVLRVLSTEVAGLTDEAFFQFIVRRLAEMLGVEFGFVGRLDGEGLDRIQTLALWAGDQFAPNILYNLEGSPCENLSDKEPRIHASDVPQQFPRDTMLVEMGIESFASIPLHDASGRPLGHLGVMSRQPLRDPRQVASTLKLFAVRTAWEIERVRISRRFTDLFEFAPDAILITNREGIITLANRQAESMFGWTRNELAGLPVESLMPEENRHGHGTLRERYLHGGAPRPMGGGRSNLRAMRKDGSIFPVDISLSPLDTEDGMMVVAAVRDISERVHAETQVLKSLHEKETLLKEIHHRVKNNLQVISSLLSMQADTVEDNAARSLLQESQHRVRAMAMIHEKLYQSDSLAKVDFGDYVSQLTLFLHRNYATIAPVHLVVDADEDVPLNIDTAIPAGLILNELVTNAFKHAFKDGQPHVLKVLLKKSDTGCSLTVADDGPGLPAGFVLGKSESLGMELVEALTAQLKASLTLENEAGTRFRLDFKELIYADRI